MCHISSKRGPQILQQITDDKAPQGSIASSLCDTGFLLLTRYAGWLFGSSSRTKKEKSKSQDLEPYQSPAERAEKLREGRAIDLAALLELKGLVQTQSVAFFTTWVEDGNPCDFAKVRLLSVVQHQSK